MRVADGEPGVQCQLDFAKMGLVYDPGAGRWRVTHALIFTAVCSRHMFVWLTFSQTLVAVIEGCEAAWRFFGGVFRVLIPDNASAIVADADAVNPRFTGDWAGNEVNSRTETYTNMVNDKGIQACAVARVGEARTEISTGRH